MFKKILFVTGLMVIIQYQCIHSMVPSEEDKSSLVEIKWLLNLSNKPITFTVITSDANILQEKTVSPKKRKKGFILTVSPETKKTVIAVAKEQGLEDLLVKPSYSPSGQTKKLMLGVTQNLKLHILNMIEEQKAIKTVPLEE